MLHDITMPRTEYGIRIQSFVSMRNSLAEKWKLETYATSKKVAISRVLSL